MPATEQSIAMICDGKNGNIVWSNKVPISYKCAHDFSSG